MLAANMEADWVMVSWYLIPGRKRPEDLRDPTHMEVMIAANHLRPGGRRGKPNQDRPLHKDLGIPERKLRAARQWAANHGMVIPTARELFEKNNRVIEEEDSA